MYRILMLALIITLGAAAGECRAAETADVPDGAPQLLTDAGTTGLARIPTGGVIPYGAYAIGVNVVDRQHRPYPGKPWDTVAHYITVGVAPRLEVTVRITNNEGKLGVQYRDQLPYEHWGGWNMDRSVGVQAQLLRQTERLPVSVAVGYQDIVGTGVYKSRYLVASHQRSRLGLHAGVGTGTLGGVFGGADYQLLPGVRLMLEHDGHRANAGLSATWRRFTLTPIFTGLELLGGGITYQQRL